MRVVIIGGVAAGPKVAARLRRLRQDAEITIVEQGELISYGGCGLPLYMGSMVPHLDELWQTSTGVLRDENYFQDYKGIRVLTRTRAVAINRAEKQVTVRSLSDGEEESLNYDYLVLATGAHPIVPQLPGSDLKQVFTLHVPQDAGRLRELLRAKQVKTVTIVGGGLIGVELADSLLNAKVKITLCEAENQVLPKLLDPELTPLVEDKIIFRKVILRLGSRVTLIEGDAENKVAAVWAGPERWEADAVVFCVGVRPVVDLAREAGLALGPTGAIQVNPELQTSDPSIFAAGDCAEKYHRLTGRPVYIPLASTAAKEARVIANNLGGLPETFPGVLGTSVLQGFDLNIGRVGLGEEEARGLGLDVVTQITAGDDMAHYHPLHAKVIFKLIAEKESGKLLGVQVCGQGEGVKRLDVAGTALNFGAKVSDLAQLDLGYAPPFASVMDVLIHAANALENKRLGRIRGVTAQEFDRTLAQSGDILVLDVREQDEVDDSPLDRPHLHIPLSRLRARWEEVPPATGYVAVCGLGIRAYEAAGFLKDKGLKNVMYLEGGMAVWEPYRSVQALKAAGR